MSCKYMYLCKIQNVDPDVHMYEGLGPKRLCIRENTYGYVIVKK